MKNKNLMIGAAAGVVVLGATAWYLSKKGKLDWKSMISSAGDTIYGIRKKISGEVGDMGDAADHGGQQLATKARQRAEHTIANMQG